MRKKILYIKKFALPAIALILILLLITAFYNDYEKSYDTYITTSIVGGELQINTSSNKRNSTEAEPDVVFDMEKIYEQILDDVGIKGIRLIQYPVGLEFKTFTTDKINKAATMYFDLNGEKTTIQMSKKASMQKESGTIVGSVMCDFQKDAIDILMTDLNKAPQYSAFFKYNQTYYIVTGIMQLDDFETMIESIFI